MGLYTSLLQNGTNSHGETVEKFNALNTDFLNDGVVGAITNTSGISPATGAFAVNAQGTPDMTVAVTAGVAYITGTPTSGVSQRVRVKMDANQNVTIAANATGGTRYDWVYIKLDADKMKDPAADASDVATLVTSRSTSSSSDNGTPPTYGYCIAVVTVANGASSISNANIADKRIQSTPGPITNSDLSTSSGELGAAWKAWTPTWTNFTGANATVTAYYTQIGKTVHFRIMVSCSGAAFGSSPTFSLPVTSVSYQLYHPLGLCDSFDAGTTGYTGQILWASTTTAYLAADNASGTFVALNLLTATLPFTWANTDILMCSGTYEAA